LLKNHAAMAAAAITTEAMYDHRNFKTFSSPAPAHAPTTANGWPDASLP
jgi:hypothetical protein